jgi:DNA-binding MarR family transcriptional regulator
VSKLFDEYFPGEYHTTMKQEIFETLVSLYLIGRRIKKDSKKQNRDLLLELIIFYFIQDRELSVSDIANIISTQTSSISEKMIDFEKNGYIEKVESPDLREKRMRITKKGNQYYRHLLENKWASTSIFFEKLNPEEFMILKKLLLKMTK